jgi:hypothetical protein
VPRPRFARAVEPPARLAYTFVSQDPDLDRAELSFRELGESTEVVMTRGPFKTEPRQGPFKTEPRQGPFKTEPRQGRLNGGQREAGTSDLAGVTNGGHHASRCPTASAISAARRSSHWRVSRGGSGVSAEMTHIGDATQATSAARFSSTAGAHGIRPEYRVHAKAALLRRGVRPSSAFLPSRRGRPLIGYGLRAGRTQCG